MKHILTAASRRLARAALSGGAMRDLEKTFKELEDLFGEPFFKHPNALPVNGEYPYYLEYHNPSQSLSDDLEHVIQALREAGFHLIKQQNSRGLGWNKWAFQKEARFLKLSAHKTLGREGVSKDRMMMTTIRLIPVADQHVWDMANDVEDEQ